MPRLSRAAESARGPPASRRAERMDRRAYLDDLLLALRVDERQTQRNGFARLKRVRQALEHHMLAATLAHLNS